MDFPFLPQRLLFTPDELNAHSLKKYDLLFSNINTSPLNESTYHHRGRPPFARPALLRSLIYKNIRRVDADDSIRRNIDRHSPEFKKLYNLRTSSERIFSRFLSIFTQYPSVKGLNATANLCTIAHITVLAVALTAVKIDQKDKLRYVKTLIPKLFL